MRTTIAILLLAAAPVVAQQVQYPRLPQMPQLVKPAQAQGPTRLLVRQSISGTMRYCQYSDGYVLTVPVSSICPLNL